MKIKKKYIRWLNYSLFISVFLYSCGKEKVEPTPMTGDYAWAVGKWEWKYTVIEYNCGFPPHPTDTIRFEDLNSTYSIEILEEGRLKRFRNNILISDQLIVVSSSSNYSILMNLDGNAELKSGVFNFQTHISHSNFPVLNADCHAISNIFEK